MTIINFTDPKIRAEYFQPTEGRIPDSVIISAICEIAAFVGPHASPDDPFISDDLCLAIWDDYPTQHVYIGHRVSNVERAGKLPIRRIYTLNKRALYAIFLQ